MAEQDTTKKKFTLRLAANLHDKLAALAEREHRSLNEQILWMLERQLEQMDPDDTTTTTP